VTIVTTSFEDVDVGVTASSFNSVSLKPPMVLWSISKTARSFPSFTGSSHFAVHVLAEDQEALSSRFAIPGADKFEGLDLARGAGGIPLIPGCAAAFQCKLVFQYDGGDHVILVGEVLTFDHGGRPPLLFHGGRYARAVAHDTQAAAGNQGEDSLSVLITSVYLTLRSPSNRVAEASGINWPERYLLGALLDKDGQTLEEIEDITRYSGIPLNTALVERLASRNLIARAEEGERLFLTAQGRDVALAIIGARLAAEAELTKRLGIPATDKLKALLSDMVAAGSTVRDDRIDRHVRLIRGLMEK
jgi:3-hydroxy-9,10-secoandrosta-1,3,5(10)-triene-9,17-dione monooxygenase reductase component